MTEGYNWYALYVRSRYEFVTRDELVRKGIDTYLPSVTRISQWKDRKKYIDFPLFPGYLFVCLPAHQEVFLTVLKTRGAVNLLSLQRGIPSVVPTEEIDSLKLLVGSGQDLDIYPSLQKGAQVRVTRGPLKGAFGKIEKSEEHYIFLVNIDILGRSVGVRMCADDVGLD